MTDFAFRQRPGDQPLPTEGQENVQDALIRHIEQRKALGIERYGRPLQTFNGRKAIKDLLEELLDGAAYAMQAEMEDAATQARIREVLNRVHATDASTGACITCKVVPPCETRRVLLGIKGPAHEQEMVVTTIHPVEEIAVHPDSLDTFKAQLKAHTVEERLSHGIGARSIFGIDVVPDPRLEPGHVRMRPRGFDDHPSARLGQQT
jgi:hypothetical protein